jgi:hypothetical protein
VYLQRSGNNVPDILTTGDRLGDVVVEWHASRVIFAEIPASHQHGDNGRVDVSEFPRDSIARNVWQAEVNECYVETVSSKRVKRFLTVPDDGQLVICEASSQDFTDDFVIFDNQDSAPAIRGFGR